MIMIVDLDLIGDHRLQPKRAATCFIISSNSRQIATPHANVRLRRIGHAHSSTCETNRRPSRTGLPNRNRAKQDQTPAGRSAPIDGYDNPGKQDS
jgi:hypothetical protein